MDVTPLGAMIQRCKDRFLDEHGVELTNGDIARRSRGALTRTRVQQLARDPIKRLPAADTIDGLARGLGIHPVLVTEAALASAGYEVPASYAEPRLRSVASGQYGPTGEAQQEATTKARKRRSDMEDR